MAKSPKSVEAIDAMIAELNKEKAKIVQAQEARMFDIFRKAKFGDVDEGAFKQLISAIKDVGIEESVRRINVAPDT